MCRCETIAIMSLPQHELFELPLRTTSVSYKRMGIDWSDPAQPQWTYTLEEGCCTNSLAFQTAKVPRGSICYSHDCIVTVLSAVTCKHRKDTVVRVLCV